MSFSFADLHRWFMANDVACEFNEVARHGQADAQMPSIGYDSRNLDPGAVFCAVTGEHAHGLEFLASALGRGAAGLWAEAAQLSALGEVPPELPVVVTPNARQALAVAARECLQETGFDVVGITGSNGKTTTKDFTRAALASKRAAASPGNLNSGWGLPAVVLSMPHDLQILVLEMGASAPGEIDTLCAIAPPRVGVITNISSAHLEFFGSPEAVARTKAGVVRGLPADGVAILPRDDEFFDYLTGEAAGAEVLSFGWSAEADLRIENVAATSQGIHGRIDGHDFELDVFGAFNALNVAAAVAVARAHDISTASALAAIGDAALSPHRSRILSWAAGWVIDDSYNANPESMASALRSLADRPAPGRRIAVLGTMAELGDITVRAHAEILECALSLELDRVWVVGESMQSAASGIDDRRLTAGLEVEDMLPALSADARVTDTWLVKGSRSARLERVVDHIMNLRPQLQPSETGKLH